MRHNLIKIMLLAAAQITISASNVFSETQRNCSFLEDYYFQQENAVADALDCLKVGYSPNIVRTTDKSTIFHLIAKSNINGCFRNIAAFVATLELCKPSTWFESLRLRHLGTIHSEEVFW